MNIVGFGLAYSYSDPTISGGSTGWNLKVWMMDNMFFEGTMRGLFTMLFGAGVILQTTRGEERGGGILVADIYYRRILWLLLFGVVHVYLMLWHGDILYPYAIFGLMLFPFRNAASKYLLTAGLFLLLCGSLIAVKHYQEDKEIKIEGLMAEQIKAQGDSLTDEQKESFDEWDEYKNSKKTEEQVQEWNEEMMQGYWSIVMFKLGLNQFMQSTLVYVFWFYDILSMMLIGMAFFKWKIFQGGHSWKTYLGMMVVGYAIGLSVNWYETNLVVSSGFDLLAMSQAEQTYQLGRVFTILGHIGFFMLFIKSGILGFLQSSLSAVGKMALSNYLIHTIICTTFFLGYGFGKFGSLERYELYYVVTTIWVVQLIYSPIWLRYFRYGPAEWLWRSLTYMKKQPFKI